ncbi:MAG: hypothetical protein GY713_14375, partial [Actinomycetia bacterium]|nr:hypothetical protein [Actinomycetes bacterium]
ESTGNVQAQVSVTEQNDPPTLTSFTTVIDTTNEDTEVELTLAELKTQGDEADVDGTVDAFVVQAVSTGTLKIGANAGSASPFAAGSNDTVDASNKAYWTPATNASGTLNAFTVKAKDDDGALSVSPVQTTVDVTVGPELAIAADDADKDEGDSGTTAFTFTVTRTGNTSGTTTVDYTVSGSAAPADAADFQGGTFPTGTVTFLDTEAGQPITVNVQGDTTGELDEGFTVTLSNPNPPTNADITTATADGTIRNDDANLVLNEIDYDQGATDGAEFIEIKNIGITTVNLNGYTLELVDDNGGTPLVYQTIALPNVGLAAGDYHVVCDTAADVPNCDQEAALGDDFIEDGDPDAVTLMQGSFTVDSVSYAGDVPGRTEDTGAADDDGSEPFVGLSRFPDGTDTNVNSADLTLHCITPGGANNLADGTGCFELSIDDVIRAEDAGPARFTVSLSHAPAGSVSVDYATADGSATAGSDYTQVTATTLTFDPSETSKTLDVTLTDDATDEPDETFTVDLSNPVNGRIADGSGEGTIQDNDGEPGLSIDDVIVVEGGIAGFTVTLVPASGKTVTVEAASANGSALAGSDYTALGATTLTFDPGDTTRTVQVQTTNDNLEENAEAFTVNLSNPVNSGLADASGTATIPVNDDDGADDEDLVPAPNGVTFGDGNGDGILDGTQGHVASLRTFCGNAWATLVIPDGQTLTEVQALPLPAAAPAAAPAEIAFPYCAFSFKVNGLDPSGGERVRLSMFVTQGPGVNGYWKPNRDGAWEDISTAVQPFGIKIRVDIEADEGGRFDEETFPGMVNDPTTFTDQGGPGWRAAVPAVPTLGGWGAWLLGTLLAGIGWLGFPARRGKS